MGPFVIVAGAESVESSLAVVKVFVEVSGDGFGFERAVESLVLAIGLRMTRPRVAQPDAKAHHPCRELCVRGIGLFPDGAVVHEHAHRHAVQPENGDERQARRVLAFVGARRHAHGKARVVVDNGQRVACD